MAKSFPTKTDKIVIIGAGPSALHMAHVLIQRGYDPNNLTLLEKTGRFGGKSVSVKMTPYNDQHKTMVHELGTCYLSPCYGPVRDLAAEFGVHTECDHAGMVHFRVFTKNEKIRAIPPVKRTLDKNGGWMPYPDFIAAMSGQPSEEKSVERVMADIIKYIKIHQEVMGDGLTGFPHKQPSPEQWEKINMTYQEFLEKNDMTSLVAMLSYFMTAQGYGGANITPAYYALMWVHPQFIAKLLSEMRDVATYKGLDLTYPPDFETFAGLAGNGPGKSMFLNGYESIWTKLVERDHLLHRIVTNCKVESVRRNDEKVYIRWVETLGSASEPREDTFDYLIVASPLKHCGKWLDLQDEEKAIFSRLTNFHFRTTLFTRDPEPEREKDGKAEHADIYADMLIGPEVGSGKVIGVRDTFICNNGDAGIANTASARREQMCYQFIGTEQRPTEAKLDEYVQEFAAEKLPGFSRTRLGCEPEGTWEYFYHFDQKGLNDGLPWRLFELQGKRRTLFVHASTNFESVLHIIQYNTMLLDTLGRLTPPPPPPLAPPAPADDGSCLCTAPPCRTGACIAAVRANCVLQ